MKVLGFKLRALLHLRCSQYGLGTLPDHTTWLQRQLVEVESRSERRRMRAFTRVSPATRLSFRHIST